MIDNTDPSYKSLLIKMYFNDEFLATGTGFLALSAKGPVLITNRHNVTGKNQITGQSMHTTGAIPNRLGIVHNKSTKLGEWKEVLEPLLNENDDPLWIEHPSLGKEADFVALPLTDTKEVAIYPYEFSKPAKTVMVGLADTVSVVGFPFGLRVKESIAIWATGFLASDREIDYNDLPVFLIDCRTRPGQSGAAVIAYRHSGKATQPDGSDAIFAGPICRFLGIYSGRIHPDSDIGMVWKAGSLEELIDSIK